MNTAWATASDGVLESRVYFCQNWRGDVVSVLSDTGRQSLSVRYSAYGVPFGSPAGDLNADGAVNFTDSNQIASWISGSVYDVRADINLDGAVDSTDQTLLAGANFGLTLGRGKLAAGQTSAAWAPGVRKGYAGYEHDGVVNPTMHVRNRVLLGELGRWSRRDPLGYVDVSNLYQVNPSVVAPLLFSLQANDYVRSSEVLPIVARGTTNRSPLDGSPPPGTCEDFLGNVPTPSGQIQPGDVRGNGLLPCVLRAYLQANICLNTACNDYWQRVFECAATHGPGIKFYECRDQAEAAGIVRRDLCRASLSQSLARCWASFVADP